jgi:CheY-like chemotaxis protein
MANPRQARILVIDDDRVVAETLRTLLEALDLEAESVTDPAAALERLEVQHYDVVVTDLLMPELTGWDVIEAVRRRRPETLVILVSGSLTDEDRLRADAQGVPVLTKPVSLTELDTVVQQALGRT